MCSPTLSLTSALVGGGWSTPRAVRFSPPPPEIPRTHCTEGWVVRRAGLDGWGNRLDNGIRSPGLSTCSQSLYRLSYLAHSFTALFMTAVEK